MRFRLFGLVMAVLVALGGAAAAQEAPNPAIEGVISDQLHAFEANDEDKAFSYAAPNIRDIFGTPSRFGEMVRQGYPMVWRPGSVKFLDLRQVAGALWQKVVITDAAGAVHVLDYEMVPAGDGWQIGGVQLLKAAAVGA